MKRIKDIVDRLKMTKAGRDTKEDMLVRYIEDVHERLCQDFSLYRQTYTVSLAQGQTSYPISRAIVEVMEVRYASSSSTTRPVEVLNYDIEKRASFGFAVGQAASEPNQCYIENGHLNLVAPPLNATGQSGYPRIELDCSIYQKLMQDGKFDEAIELHPSLPNCDAYVYGVQLLLLADIMIESDDAAKDANKVALITRNFEEATSRIAVRVRRINGPAIITSERMSSY